jgi:hypothetical protein
MLHLFSRGPRIDFFYVLVGIIIIILDDEVSFLLLGFAEPAMARRLRPPSSLKCHFHQHVATASRLFPRKGTPPHSASLRRMTKPHFCCKTPPHAARQKGYKRATRGAAAATKAKTITFALVRGRKQWSCDMAPSVTGAKMRQCRKYWVGINVYCN